MKKVILLMVFSLSLGAQAIDTWPGIVYTFSGQAPYSHKQNEFLINIKALPITGGSGGRYYEITLLRDGKILGTTITEAVFSFSVLDMNNGFPQLEAWSSGGAEKYTRLLYRWNGTKFSVARIDDYIKTMNQDSAKSYTPEWAKKYGFALTHRSTRTPK